MKRLCLLFAPSLGFLVGLAGCHSPSVTAVSLNHYCDHKFPFLYDPCKDQEGIPFYLPKPLLIVAKNFRNIEETKVGLTDSVPIPTGFDKQADFANLSATASFNFDGGGAKGDAAASGADSVAPPGTTKKASQAADGTPNPPSDTNLPPASTSEKSAAYTYSENAPHVTPHDVPSDGLAPNTFFTYHIVFVPDMTQKYGLKIKGGPGEIRAAMNLVNGWQFTGLGPYYMKDSSTAQDVMASGIAARLGGQAVADVLKGVAGLSGRGVLNSATVDAGAPQVQSLARTISELPREQFPVMALPNFAEIHVYEASLTPDGQMEWHEITNLSFNRDYIGGSRTKVTFQEPATPPNPGTTPATPAAKGAAAADASKPQSAVPGETGTQAGLTDAARSAQQTVATQAVANLLGLPANHPALVQGIPATTAQRKVGPRQGLLARHFNKPHTGLAAAPAPAVMINNNAVPAAPVALPANGAAPGAVITPPDNSAGPGPAVPSASGPRPIVRSPAS
jgi:hypothetical protein